MDKSLKLESEKVHSIRKLSGLNQKKFGEAVGVSLSTIFRWENGERVCSGESVRKVLAFERSLNVEPVPSTSIFQLSTEHLSRLNSDRAVEAFRNLLWATAAQAGLPKSSVKICAREISDGGIDAEVLDVVQNCKLGLLKQGENFYQLKAGGSWKPWQPSFAKKELLNNKGGLGSAVIRCMQSNGIYVLVCFGIDLTTDQTNQAKGNLEKEFRQNGYPHPKVEVWSQQELIGFFEHFPSLCLRLSDRESVDFQSWSNWKLEREMSLPLQLGQRQKKLIADIQGFLHTKEVSHIRIIGEPGLGKTRLVLEALADVYFQSYVIYVRHAEDFQRSQLFNQLANKHNNYSVILVVDECEPKECKDIWNRLSPHFDRCQIISIGHTSYEMPDDEFQEFSCPPLEDESIAAIIQDYTNYRVEVRHWAKLLSGCPRLAHAVGENLAKYPDDILKAPTLKDALEVFVAGYHDIKSEESKRKLRVLWHIALFQKFGNEDPVREEAEYIVGLIQKAHPNFTSFQFDEIVRELRNQKILQGSRTLFIAPKLLHIHLWQEFWETYRGSHSLTDLVKTMPPTLTYWFTGMFSYAGTSDVAKLQAKKLLGHGSPMRDPGFALSPIGCRIFHELSNASPEEVLKCLEDVIDQADQSQLINLRDSRRNIVRALKRIAMQPELFCGAAMVLRELALAENAENSNNSTGTFVGLFSLAPGGMAPTGATPDQRRPVLIDSLGHSSDEVKRLGVKACKCAMSTDRMTRGVGTEIQGWKTVDLWTPNNWDEVYDAKREVWSLFYEQTRGWNKELRSEANQAIIDAAGSMIYEEYIRDQILDMLFELSEDSATDLQPIIELISSSLNYRPEHLGELAVQRLKGLELKITGTSFADRVRRHVHLCGRDDYYTDGKYDTEQFNQRIIALAKEAIENEPGFLEMLPGLVQGTNDAVLRFAVEIANYDDHRYWPLILEAYQESNESLTSSFLKGYLATRYDLDQQQWEGIVKQLLMDDSFSLIIGDILGSSGLTEKILTLLFQEIGNGRINHDQLTRLVYSSVLDNLREIAFLAYINELLYYDHFSDALQAFQRRYEKHNGLLPEKDTFLLLQELGENESDKADYQWKEIAERYLNENPNQAMEVFSILLKKVANTSWHHFLYTELSEVVVRIIKSDPEKCWNGITQRIDRSEESERDNLIHFLGPMDENGTRGTIGLLHYFPKKLVFNWVDEDPENRAYELSSIVPKSLANDDAGSWTRELLIRYGYDSRVSGGLLSHFAGDGCMGSESQHYRRRRKTARGWLDGEEKMRIRTWLEQYIEYLNSNIEQAELDEERRI